MGGGGYQQSMYNEVKKNRVHLETTTTTITTVNATKKIVSSYNEKGGRSHHHWPHNKRVTH